jgi:hypothetical protein
MRQHPRRHYLYGRLSASALAERTGRAAATIRGYYAEDGIAAPRRGSRIYWAGPDLWISVDGAGRVSWERATNDERGTHRAGCVAGTSPIEGCVLCGPDYSQTSCWYVDAGLWVTCVWGEMGILLGWGNTRLGSIRCAVEGRGLDVPLDAPRVEVWHA